MKLLVMCGFRQLLVRTDFLPHRECHSDAHISLALDLAKEYKMYDWVRALLDPSDIVQSPSSAKKQITPPPKFDLPPIQAPVQLSAATTRPRRGRSASPSKSAASPRKARQTRAMKEASSAATTAANASLQSSLDSTALNGGSVNGKIEESVEVDEKETQPAEVNEELQAIPKSKQAVDVADPEAEEEKKVKADVKQSAKKGKGAKTTQDTVSPDMPVRLPDAPSADDTEQMIAKAKEMVQDTEVEKEGEPAESSSPKGAAKKRKTDDLSEDEEDEETKAASTQRVKRARVLEEKLKRERVRNRALVGVTAAFAVA